jgi:hypothetical protein
MKACIRLSSRLDYNSLNVYHINVFRPKIVGKKEQMFFVQYTSSLSLSATDPHPKPDESTSQTRTGFNIGMCMSDYRWSLDWYLYLLSAYRTQLQVTIALSLIHTIYNSLQHALSLFSLLCLHQLPGNGFQRRSFLSFRVHVLTGRRLSPK